MSPSTSRLTAGRSTGPSSFLSFTLAAAVLLSLVSSASALPTFRRAPAPGAIAPESLFRRAAQHVGPVRPVERLRLRRNLESVPHGLRNADNAALRPVVPVTAAAVNPKRTKRDVVGARSSNPKVKRALMDAGVRAANPKAKRADDVTEPEPEQHFANVARRAAGLPAIVLNPKKRSLDLQKRAVVEASISVSPSPSLASRAKRSVKRGLVDRVRRFLAARATSTTPVFSPGDHRTILAVPNPKSPNFPGKPGASSSSSATPSETSSSASSTSKPASTTTTSKPTTTTTSKPVTTTTTTTTTSAAPTPTGEKKLSGAYYPSWVTDTLPPSKINYRLFDVINFGKAAPLLLTVPDWLLTCLS